MSIRKLDKARSAIVRAPCVALVEGPARYRVAWAIDVDALDADEAARMACAAFVRGGRLAFTAERQAAVGQGCLMLGLGAERVEVELARQAARKAVQPGGRAAASRVASKAPSTLRLKSWRRKEAPLKLRRS